MKIDWKKYVDHIYNIHYYDSKANVYYDNYIKELKRVDILNSKIYEEFIGVPSPVINTLGRAYRNISSVEMPKDDYIKYFNLFFNDYLIIKRAYLLGYEKILILEDDGIFLKNKEDIIEILDKTIDIFKTHESCIFLGGLNIRLSNFRNDYDKGIQFNNLVYTYDHKKYWSGGAGFNIYNRGAMKQYIDLFESFNFVIPDQYAIYNKDTYITFSVKNICIQNQWVFMIKNCYKYYNLYKPTLEQFNNYVNTSKYNYNKFNENDRQEIVNQLYNTFKYSKKEQKIINEIYVKNYFKNEK